MTKRIIAIVPDNFTAPEGVKIVESKVMSISFDDIVKGIKWENDDTNPFDMDDCLTHEKEEMPYYGGEHESEQRKSKAFFHDGRNGRFLIKVSEDEGYFKILRENGYPRQVAREIVQGIRNAQIEAIKDYYSDRIWNEVAIYKDDEANVWESLGGIENGYYKEIKSYHDDMEKEFAEQVASAYVKAGWEVTGMPEHAPRKKTFHGNCYGKAVTSLGDARQNRHDRKRKYLLRLRSDKIAA